MALKLNMDNKRIGIGQGLGGGAIEDDASSSGSQLGWHPGKAISNVGSNIMGRKADRAENWGMQGLADWRNQRSDWRENLTPGQLGRDLAGGLAGLGPGGGDKETPFWDRLGPGGIFQDERGKAFMSPWQQGLDNMSGDYLTGNTDYFQDIKDNGPFGGRYSGREEAALGGLSGAGASLGGDVMALRGQLQNQKGGLERQMERNYGQALRGGLTNPDSQAFRAQSAIIDRERGDALDEFRNQMGASRGLGSGQFGKGVGKIITRGEQDKMNALTQMQQATAARADTFLSSNKAANNQVLGMAADLAKAGRGFGIQGQSQILGHINNAGNMADRQAGMRLETDLARFDQDNTRLQNVADKTEFEFDGDMRRKELMSNNFQAFMSMMGNMIGGGGGGGLFGLKNKGGPGGGLSAATNIMNQF